MSTKLTCLQTLFSLLASRFSFCAHLIADLCLQRAAHRRPHAARQVSPFACFLVRLQHSARKGIHHSDRRSRQSELSCLVIS